MNAKTIRGFLIGVALAVSAAALAQSVGYFPPPDWTWSYNGGVVAALNGVYRPVLTLFEQAHRQEHRFKVRYGYCKLDERFDKLVHCLRRWRGGFGGSIAGDDYNGFGHVFCSKR